MPRRLLAAALAAASGAALAVALPAGAAQAAGTTASCTPRNESQAFKRWGDQNNYFTMPNGGFESGATDWWLSGGAGVVTGNEPYYVRSSKDSKSLRIPYGGRAESRTICVAKGEDSIRLFAKNDGVPGSVLHVDVVSRNPQTGAKGYASFDVNGDAVLKGWSPTISLKVPNLLSSTTGTQELTVTFTTRGAATTWAVDDVFVDPFRSN